MNIRTRFAPSPTGYLHIGGARTALYCWLFAKKQGGQFILRIEDTDKERSTDASIQAILDSMTWLGLDYDEGPFYQSHRFTQYLAAAEKLIQAGNAYRCYCSKERLDTLRAKQLEQKQKPRYDGHCRYLQEYPQDKPFVIRFKNPETGMVQFTDLIHGSITVHNAELDDLVIIRTDGIPTYNFSCVIDDIDMNITHVIRGDDHINNTPRQINLLNALGASRPIYAHVPMILGSDGKRLSKRHGAVSVLQYRDDGYLPEALLNYLVRLGWAHGNQEIFTRDELMSLFELEAVHKASAAFNPEKLTWLNQHYLKTLPYEILAPHLTWHAEQQKLPLHQGPPLPQLLEAQKERAKTLVELIQKSHFFYDEQISYDQTAVEKFLNVASISILQVILNALEQVTVWQKDVLHQIITQIAETHHLKLGQVAQPLRVALTGNTISPPMDLTLELLGQKKTLLRLQQIIQGISDPYKVNVRG